MAALIDASVLIAVQRGTLDLGVIRTRFGDTPFALSPIVVSELLHGSHRTREATTKARIEAFVEGILQVMPVIPFDLVAARIHASVWADLVKRGIAVGAHDLIIAATAISRNHSVITRDQRSFPKIRELEVHLV